MTKTILYIATSLDGFIADKDGGVDWLPQPADEGDEFGYQALMKRIGVIVMGSRSYQQILGFGDWAWPDKTTYVFTAKQLTTDREDVHFVHENVSTFMKKLCAQKSTQDVWLLGGAELVKSFAAAKQIDECVITVIPKILSTGIKLELPFDGFDLVQTKECTGGIVQKIYLRLSDKWY